MKKLIKGRCKFCFRNLSEFQFFFFLFLSSVGNGQFYNSCEYILVFSVKFTVLPGSELNADKAFLKIKKKSRIRLLLGSWTFRDEWPTCWTPICWLNSCQVVALITASPMFVGIRNPRRLLDVQTANPQPQVFLN